MNFIDLFYYPFFIKGLIASIWIGIVFSILGIFVSIKKMSFFSDGLAHSAVLGLAIAFLLNYNFFIFALIAGFIFSSLIYFLERKTKFHTDALIGFVFVFALSLGLILISKKAGYQPELLNFLIGNILTLSDLDFFAILVFSLLILIFLIFNLKKLLIIFIDPVEAKLQGLNVHFYEYLFYVILGIGVILGIRVVGIILITAFIILPPLISSLISRSLKEMIILSMTFSLINIILGFLISGVYNFPLSSTITLIGCIFFFIFLIWSIISKKRAWILKNLKK